MKSLLQRVARSAPSARMAGRALLCASQRNALSSLAAARVARGAVSSRVVAVDASVASAAVSAGARAVHSSSMRAAGGSAGPAPTSGVIPFLLADIGEGIAECEVMKWFVNVGDKIHQFDKVCLVQSDKATVEITSRYDGTVKALHYKKGDMAKVGSPLIDIDLGGAPAGGAAAAPAATAAAPSAAAAAPAARAAAAAPAVAGAAAEGADGKPLASPAVRRIAKENNINLSQVQATGPKGRILKEDVQNFMNGGARAAAAPAPTAATAAAPAAAAAAAVPAPAAPAPPKGFPAGLPAAGTADVTTPITGLARVMVQTMTASNAVPQFGYCDEIVMDGLMAMRDALKKSPPPGTAHTTGKDAVRISYMPFIIKATSMALRQYPQLNAHVNAACTELTVKAAHNIALAMDTPRGLLVPNIKNVQNLSVWQIAAELNRLQTLGKAGMIGRADLQGGTFTLSNIGTIGGTYSKPLVVVPEIVIGALGKIQTLPRFTTVNGAQTVVPQNLMVVSWSADHRMVDGATMARFSNLWKYYLENPQAMLLDTR